ncbi:kelch-like protein 41 [Ruditapes philippinarum]|uniref:kelch-like protein 41 n=1 Tax=Ruditapes philippinarum TaxID=129788 RepID=UPI00295B5EA4|nr:kelch-like protein 41 [Ruditapes philippinarum]
MFLYGKKPKLNDENIENILHMAEFLLIPNLKSACISWLKTVSITRENCMKFLQLSSIYDFEIPRCTKYIEEHLPEMFLQPQMVNLTKDFIHLLFSNKRLSYVQMDDRLLFLLKWLEANPNTRKAHIKELLTTIDFHSISNQCLQVCLHNPDVACHLPSEHLTTAALNDHRVLIMKGGYNEDDVFWCLDLERDQ